jgi:hypothetical protein
MPRTYRPVEATKKRRKKGLIPLFGLVLAIMLGIIAYIVAPYGVELLENRSEDIARQLAQFRVDYGERAPDYVAAFLLWIVMLAILAYPAAATIGQDPEKEVFKYMGPSPADRDKRVKQLRRELKEAKRREKQHKSS